MSHRPGRRLAWHRALGFSLIEAMIVVLLVAALAAWAGPALFDVLSDMKLERGMADMAIIESAINSFYSENDRFPDSLDELALLPRPDPWGRPFQYLSSLDPQWNGKRRKDRFIVPLNSDYDLYSMGADGKSKPPLTAKDSRDDIVRANNGTFIGPASEF